MSAKLTVSEAMFGLLLPAKRPVGRPSVSRSSVTTLRHILSPQSRLPYLLLLVAHCYGIFASTRWEIIFRSPALVAFFFTAIGVYIVINYLK